MRRTLFPLTVAALALASCQAPATSVPAPPPGPTDLPSALPTPTPSAPPPTPWPTVAPRPFYHLRLEFWSTSDWSDLILRTAEPVLTARLVGTEGDPAVAAVGVSQLSLGQPFQAAEAGRRVSLTADFALDSNLPGDGLEFRLEKGDIGSSGVRVSMLGAGEATRLLELRHDGVVRNTGGRNPLAFTVDLSTVLGRTPEIRDPSAGGFERLLWAFYYPWYTRQDWSSSILRDVPLTPYNSADRATIENHVHQAKDSGIDGFISSWWGPGSDTDARLRTLLDVAQSEDFLVTIYFETLTGEGPLPASEIVRWLTYVLRNYGDHPAFARVDGRPVVVLWASDTVPLETWREILNQVRLEGLDPFTLGMGYSLTNLEVFDGLHAYGVFTLPRLEQTVASVGEGVRFYGLLQDEPSPELWAATVQPGYDDRRIPGREGLVQERGEGAFYRRTWEAALASNPDWIFITTWNEWWEHTHIEPSRDFGDLYLKITRDYAASWKGE